MAALHAEEAQVYAAKFDHVQEKARAKASKAEAAAARAAERKQRAREVHLEEMFTDLPETAGLSEA